MLLPIASRDLLVEPPRLQGKATREQTRALTVLKTWQAMSLACANSLTGDHRCGHGESCCAIRFCTQSTRASAGRRSGPGCTREYTNHARKVSATGRRRRARTGPGRERSAGIRAWARQRGTQGERARPYSRDDHPGVRGLALTRLRARVGGQMRAGRFRRAAVRGPARRDRQQRSQPGAQSAGQRRIASPRRAAG